MVGEARSGWALLVPLMILAAAAAGQDGPVPPIPDGTVLPGDLEEVEDVLRTLDEAGVPATQEDIARFLRDQEAGRAGRSGAEEPQYFSGALHYRVGHYHKEGLDHYGKISLQIPWLRLRGRIRQYRTGLQETTGAVELGYGPIDLRAGVLGLSHGHGLLVGPPGRGSSLGADSGFRPASERMVTWLGSDDSRAVSGYGAAMRLGPWDLRFIREKPGVWEPDRAGPQNLVQVGVGKEDWRVSVAGQTSGGTGGASISAGMMKKHLSGSLEVMALKSAPGIPAAGAAVLQVKWSPVRGSGLEGVFGFADLPAKPELSSRPAVLPGWAGRGVAVRGFTRTGSGLVLRAMIHLGRHLDRPGTRSRNTKMLVDLQASKKPLPPIEVALRFRRDTRRVWEWSERYPWQAPQLAETGHRTIVSAQIAFEKNQSRARLLIRSYGLETRTGNGRRSLAGLSGSRAVGRGWKLRATWVNAWGDPVDLVSAVSPVSGYVLPRHWGRWRSETLLGMEKVSGGLRIQAAVSLRHPERGIAGGLTPTFWATAGFRW